MPDRHSLEALSAEDFRDEVGSVFRLSMTAPKGSPAVSVELELVKVSQPPGSARGAFRAPFSMLLHGPVTPVMPQAIYLLKHDELGMIELFIVPIGPEEPAAARQAPTAMRYEAVFG